MTSRHEAYIHQQLDPDNLPNNRSGLHYRRRTQDIAREEWERLCEQDREKAREFYEWEERQRGQREWEESDK